MNLTRRTLLGIVKYPAILDLSSPQYQYIELRKDQSRYVKIADWKPGKRLIPR